MSGHSKWATIKRKKEATDNKRGQLFTKLTREIQVAAREGGADMDANFRLRLAVERARADSMPADNIQRAIQRGAGASGTGENFEEITYEGYGPQGTAMMVSALTDNRNRTAAEIRAAFTRGGGNLGEAGSVAWMFDSMGLIAVEPASGTSTEDVEMAAIEAGAQDVKVDEEENVVEIYTDRADLKAVQDSLRAAGLNVVSAELSMIPRTTIQLDGEKANQNMRLIERLEELDDVQQVYSNLELTREQVESLA